MRFKLFHTEDTYKRQEEAFREEFVAITDRISEWVVKDIPLQDYTVVVYHDENGNEEFDKNFLGIPKESYGFSNNVRQVRPTILCGRQIQPGSSSDRYRNRGSEMIETYFPLISKRDELKRTSLVGASRIQ